MIALLVAVFVLGGVAAPLTALLVAVFVAGGVAAPLIALLVAFVDMLVGVILFTCFLALGLLLV